MRTLPILLLLAACSRPELTDPVPSGSVIAGTIEDPAALVGGSAGEGRLGDFLLKNDRARFVVQAARDDGNYYEPVGGGVIDADIVREGGPDHDIVDEWMGMFGLGRIGRATAVEVVDDGRRSGEAVVRVTAEEAPLRLFTGSVENEGVVPDLGLTVVTDYILRPDTPLLEVRSTITAGDEPIEAAPGDVLQGGLEAADPWDPGVGLDTPGDDERRLTAYLHRHNQAAWAIVPEPGQRAELGADGRLLASLGDLLASFQEPGSLGAGESLVFTRYYAVAPDLAAITDATLALDGTPTTTTSGTVTAGGSPVAGARVHVLVDGEPFTVAVTDPEGAWSALVPEGANVTTRASGQLDGITLDVGEASGGWGPYAHPDRNALVQVTGPDPRIADGYGLAAEDAPDTLVAPARLTVRASDGLPFEVQVRGTPGPDDPRLVTRPPDGTLALGWAADGAVTLNVPPGEVSVLVHRGLRFERVTQDLSLAPGQDSYLDVELPLAISAEGWLLADPHSHASPSGDGRVTMAERLLGSAARGLHLHVGSDHDHVADYRGLVSRLGLEPHLRSLVANEVSPTLRGHVNAWPLAPGGGPNGGAVDWWTTFPESTDALVAQFQEMGGGNRVFVQMNHPLDNGLMEVARWRPGEIGRADRWTGRADLFELNNAGDAEDNLAGFFDLITRGYRVAPVGVSDAHGPTSGGLGLNATWLGTGTTLAEVDEDSIRAALAAGRTQTTRGLFLEMSLDPGSTVTGSRSLQVEAVGASWATADRIVLYRDGEVAETVAGTSATFALEPDADAVYVVIAEGDTALGGAYGGARPWVLASPIYVDVEGDGWEAPKDALRVGR